MKFSLQLDNVVKKFGNFKALDNINLSIKEGEVFAYLGPNGSGKSTTIRVLLGILQATSGNVKVLGMDAWKNATEIHKRIAYVPGDVNLWPSLTGGEVIDLFVSLRGTYNKALRDKLVRDFDLDATKKCRTYSKGNRQKVALIAAFASNADLFILDEPTSGLDPLMEQVFQSYVLEQKNKGRSVFLSSHIMSEVERLCDRMGIIRDGKLVETGTLSDLRHLTRYHMDIVTMREPEGLGKINGIHNISIEEQNGQRPFMLPTFRREIAEQFPGIQKNTRFEVDTEELDAVIRYISQFGIQKLECAPPSLEELFMRHYDTSAGGKLS